jgi:hypothetical protein
LRFNERRHGISSMGKVLASDALRNDDGLEVSKQNTLLGQRLREALAHWLLIAARERSLHRHHL